MSCNVCLPGDDCVVCGRMEHGRVYPILQELLDSLPTNLWGKEKFPETQGFRVWSERFFFVGKSREIFGDFPRRRPKRYSTKWTPPGTLVNKPYNLTRKTMKKDDMIGWAILLLGFAVGALIRWGWR